MMEFLKRFAENPYVHLFSGLILVVTSVAEIVSSFGEGSIGAHHGIAIFGFIQILKTLPHLHHGAEEVSKIVKE